MNSSATARSSRPLLSREHGLFKNRRTHARRLKRLLLSFTPAPNSTGTLRRKQWCTAYLSTWFHVDQFMLRRGRNFLMRPRQHTRRHDGMWSWYFGPPGPTGTHERRAHLDTASDRGGLCEDRVPCSERGVMRGTLNVECLIAGLRSRSARSI
jgi:hypothetical protein